MSEFQKQDFSINTLNEMLTGQMHLAIGVYGLCSFFIGDLFNLTNDLKRIETDKYSIIKLIKYQAYDHYIKTKFQQLCCVTAHNLYQNFMTTLIFHSVQIKADWEI